MTIKRTCKYPGCVYYNKSTKHYCCSACSCDHYSSKQLNSIITKIRKEYVMDKIKREWSYKTSDGKVFLGKSAVKNAENHQKRLNFRESIKDAIPQARKIFNIPEPDFHKDGEIDEDEFLDKVNNELDWDCRDFKDFLNRLVTAYFEIPELPEFFQFIKKEFNEYK